MGSSPCCQMRPHRGAGLLNGDVEELDAFVLQGDDFPGGRSRGADLRAGQERETMHQYARVETC